MTSKKLVGDLPSFIFSFKKPLTVFPTICLRTSPTPIGLMPGLLSGEMSLQDVKALSKDGCYDFLSRFLVNMAISSLKILPSAST